MFLLHVPGGSEIWKEKKIKVFSCSFLFNDSKVTNIAHFYISTKFENIYFTKKAQSRTGMNIQSERLLLIQQKK